jgi:hypothetical protein
MEVSPFLIASPAASFAALPPASRDVEVGGGYDLLSEKRGAADADVVYPISMKGALAWFDIDWDLRDPQSCHAPGCCVLRASCVIRCKHL